MSIIATKIYVSLKNIEQTLKNAKEDSDRQITSFNSQIQKTFRDIEKSNSAFLDTNRDEFSKTREEFLRIKNSIDTDLDKVVEISVNAILDA